MIMKAHCCTNYAYYSMIMVRKFKNKVGLERHLARFDRFIVHIRIKKYKLGLWLVRLIQ